MRARFGERPAAQQRGRGFMVTLGLIGILIAGGLTYVGFNAPNSIPGRGYYNLKAQFADADNIAPHGQVRIGGKIVGQVLRPRIEDGLAIVDLQIDPQYEPLRSDTIVEVRPRSAVGVRYVDIRPGPSGTPLGEGDMIPAENTRATRPLDEVLGTFDPKTRVRTQQFLREFGTGFAGRGEDLNETLQIAPDALRGTDEVLGEIADRDDSAGSLIRGSATAAGAADPVRQQIRDGFEPGAKALRPFSDEGDALRSTLEKAPPTLSTLSGRLPAVRAFATELEGFAGRVRPVLAAAPGAFRQTSALLTEARPSLRDADDTLKLANRAVNPTIGLLDTVRPVLPIITSTLDNSTPIVTRLGAYGCDFSNFGRRWSEMMAYGNDAGGVLRFNLVTPGPSNLAGIGELGGLNQTGVLRKNYAAPCTAGSEKVPAATRSTPVKAGR